MLPTVMTARRTLVAALTAASIAAVPAAPALAWGDKEQSFVAGVATAVLIDRLFLRDRRARVAQPAPVYNFVEPAAPATTSIYRTPAARAFQSYSAAERKAIQRQLRAYGYYHGGLDGSFGPGTYGAIKTFAADEGLSGKLSGVNTAFGVYDSLLY
ncbi:MAG: peptidoglycan-binding domain-containing protein [Rhodobacterales bacterium]|nr:peptidoglycan-binding domain-containing protein [Rhodobacterales bacterium]